MNNSTIKPHSVHTYNSLSCFTIVIFIFNFKYLIFLKRSDSINNNYDNVL